MGILSAVNSLDEYTRNVMLEDLEKNNKSLDDIVTITKTYNFFKRNASGDILPLNSNDLKIIQQKIEQQQSPYEMKLEKFYETKINTSYFSPVTTVKAYEQEKYDGITVTTWATDYSSGSNYDVRYKLFGVFNWLWDDNSDEDYEYLPNMSGDDYMTLNWAGNLTLETERYAEVQVKEYPWDTENVVYTYETGDSSGFIELADVEPNGGIGFRFDEKYPLGAPAYNAQADNGHMSVFVHRNNSTGEDGNFKFTYTHTWKSADIGYSITPGAGSSAGSISINFSDKTKNFEVYDLVSM